MAYQYKNKWLGGYETVRFNTADGDLDFTQYARLDGGYIIRDRPKQESNFRWAESADVTGLEEVRIIGKAYYNRFRSASGKIVRVPTTGNDYWRVAKVKNAAQPERIELVDVLPTFDDNRNNPEHHSIGYDTMVLNDQEVGPMTAWSWSHECTGDNRMLVIANSLRVNDENSITVTYNGDSCTQEVMRFYSTNQTFLHWIIAPDTGGSYTVSVVTTNNTYFSRSGSVSYTGVDQTNPIDASVGRYSYSALGEWSLDTTEDNCWVMSVVTGPNNGVPGEMTGNETVRYNTYLTTSSFDTGFNDTDGPVSPGTHTMTWEFNVIGIWTLCIIAIAPSAETTPTDLEGTISGQSSASGNIKSKKAVGGSVEGQGSLSGAATVKKSLSGTISATGGLSATLLSKKPLSGSIAGAGDLSGAIGSKKSIAGSCVGQSFLTGAIESTGKQLAGQIDAQSELSGDIKSDMALSGSIDAAGTLTGSAKSKQTLSGTIAGQSTAVGNLKVIKFLSGTVNGQSGTSAGLQAKQNLAGTVAGQSAASGDLQALSQTGLSGTIAGHSTAAGELRVIKIFDGTVSVQSGISGQLSERAALIGIIVAQATAEGNLRVVGLGGVLSKLNNLAGENPNLRGLVA
jgi:hypothetical protein